MELPEVVEGENNISWLQPAQYVYRKKIVLKKFMLNKAFSLFNNSSIVKRTRF